MASALGLDLDNTADKAKIKGMIKAWIKAKHLVEVDRLDEDRHEHTYIEVGTKPSPVAGPSPI